MNITAAMLTEEMSMAIFVLTTVVLTVAVVALAPRFLVRLGMGRLVPALAVIGPLISSVLILVGAGTMALSGQGAELMLLMALLVGVATVVLGKRLAQPITSDMETVSAVIDQVAHGSREPANVRVATAEAAKLLDDVEVLRRSLVQSEYDRTRADHARRTTVAALSHDLRTPLHSLMATVEALEDGIGSSERNLGQLRLNVRALDQLVTDLFLVAQAEAGTLRFSSHPMDVAEVIDDVAEAVRPVATTRGVTLDAFVDRSVMVEGEELAVGRILRNLLDNAIRHTQSGGRVTIDARNGPRGWVDIEVRDQGPGLPQSIVDGADPTAGVLRDHGGVGIGFAIASSLAVAAGGRVATLPGPPGRVVVSLRTPA